MSLFPRQSVSKPNVQDFESIAVKMMRQIGFQCQSRQEYLVMYCSESSDKAYMDSPKSDKEDSSVAYLILNGWCEAILW